MALRCGWGGSRCSGRWLANTPNSAFSNPNYRLTFDNRITKGSVTPPPYLSHGELSGTHTHSLTLTLTLTHTRHRGG